MLKEINSKSNYIHKFRNSPITTSTRSLISSKRFPLHLFSTCVLCSQQNHYQTLGLDKNATAGQIKSKFYQLSRTHHPDMNPSSSGAADRFKQISEAYTVLSDRKLRQQYDSAQSDSFSRYTSGTYANMSSNCSTENGTRRQNANYAWSTRRSRTNFKSELRGRQDPFSGKSHMEDFSATLNRFERLARRKRSASTPSSSSSNTFTDPWQNPSSTHKSAFPKSSAATQTIQLAFMLSFIFWIGSKFHV